MAVHPGPCDSAVVKRGTSLPVDAATVTVLAMPPLGKDFAFLVATLVGVTGAFSPAR